EILAPEEPAARPLVDVAAQRAEVADERRGYRQSRLCQERIALLQVSMLDDVGKRRRCADVRAVRADLDALEVGNGGEVDNLNRDGHAFARNPVLHDAADQVAAAAEGFAGRAELVQQPDGILDRGRFVEFEALHYRGPPAT